MPRLMQDLQWKETSGVDRAANLSSGWTMIKDATPETAALLEQAARVADPTIGRNTMPFNKEALEPEARAYIDGLEKALMGRAPAPTAAAVPTEAEIFAKALEDTPPAIRKALIDNQRKAAEADEMLKSMVIERERAEYTALAKSLTHVPEVTAEFGETIRKAYTGDADSVTALVKALQASERVLKTSAAFNEVGSSAPAPDSAEAEIAGIAKGLVEKDKNLTYAEALTKAAGDNPETYARYRVEMNRKNNGLEA